MAMAMTIEGDREQIARGKTTQIDKKEREREEEEAGGEHDRDGHGDDDRRRSQADREQIWRGKMTQIDEGHIIKSANLGDYVKDNIPTLKHFMVKGHENQEYNVASLVALSSALRQLQRHEFKNNHGEWVSTVKPDLGPGISERVWEAVRSTDENIDVCTSVKTELRAALTALLGDFGILAIPTTPGPPPKLQTEPTTLETFRVGAFSLLAVAGVSGFCQVSIPLGTYDNLPVEVSMLAKHGSDGFLLNLVETLYETLKKQIEITQEQSY